ncbi:hypothetical protein [Devosia beringensis]|uniref:hypothetical protein n=1 Tax=Devosia beringensis TaxID=2657486 RepID=UPI00186B93A2|nr:hypothetical protein [Devosia beringensis]
MAFEIMSFKIVSLRRHPALRNHVRANVVVGLVENLGSYMIDLNLRVIVEEDEQDEAVRLAVLTTAARVIRRITSAIDQRDVGAAPE